MTGILWWMLWQSFLASGFIPYWSMRLGGLPNLLLSKGSPHPTYITIQFLLDICKLCACILYFGVNGLNVACATHMQNPHIYLKWASFKLYSSSSIFPRCQHQSYRVLKLPFCKILRLILYENNILLVLVFHLFARLHELVHLLLMETD